MTFDDYTKIVWLSPIVIYAVWQTVALIRRARGAAVGTISMVAMRTGYRLTSVVYFWTSMPFHWWGPFGRWASTWGTAAFWIIQAALLVLNVARWRKTARPLAEWPTWERWLNWPVWWMVVGPLAATFLFPQNAPVPWRP